MDSEGEFHVWSIPFGYCDDEAASSIKDEEVTADSSGSFPDLPETDSGGPSNPASDPLNIDTNGDELSSPPDPGTLFYYPDEVSLMVEEPAELGDSTVTSAAGELCREEGQVHAIDELSADSEGSQEVESCMSFKAEPEEDSQFLVLDPDEASPPRTSPREAASTAFESLSHLTTAQVFSMNVIDPESGRDLHRCRICHVAFKRQLQLVEHFRCEHPGCRPFSCSICHRGFYQGSFLYQHLRMHKSGRELVCGACDRRFLTRQRINQHLKTSRLCPASMVFDAQALKRHQEAERMLLINERRLQRQRRLGIRPGPPRPGVVEEVLIDD